MMSHVMKLWIRVVEARQQYGFMPKTRTTGAMLMEKYREDQRELHCVFMDLEKPFDNVPKEELW